MTSTMLREWIKLVEMRTPKQVSPEELARRTALRSAMAAVTERYPSARTEQRGFTTFIMARDAATRRDNLLGSGGSDEKAWLDAAEQMARDDADDLDEAPIGDLEVHKMDAPGTFPASDRKLMKSKAHLKKVRHAFAKTHFNFDLYFVNQPGESYLNHDQGDDFGDDPDYPNADADDVAPSFSAGFESDVQDYAGVHDNGAELKKKFGVAVEPKPGIITVVYLSNANVETTIPLTPWIIAHRFGHAVTDENNKGGFTDTVGKIRQYASSREGRKALMANMTMRSARSGTLQETDYVEELIAQYLITGKVTFRDESLNWIGESIAKTLQQCVGHLFVTV